MNANNRHWEFREQQPKKAPEEKEIPSQVKNMYQTILKQIKNADTPANLKIAMKKKEKMDAKYPTL